MRNDENSDEVDYRREDPGASSRYCEIVDDIARYIEGDMALRRLKWMRRNEEVEGENSVSRTSSGNSRNSDATKRPLMFEPKLGEECFAVSENWKFPNDVDFEDVRDYDADIQGIPWGVGHILSRRTQRNQRFRDYNNYENCTVDHSKIRELAHRVWDRKTFYKFHSSTQRVRTRILHFQLRNLLWATSPHDLYTIDLHKVYHYSTLTKKITPVIEINPSAGPNSKTPAVTACQKLEVSTICANKDIIALGSFYGDLVCYNLHTQQTIFSGRIAYLDESAITNAIEIISCAGREGGGVRIVTSNNDCRVRVFDPFRGVKKPMMTYSFDWPVNHVSFSPDKAMLCVVGDNKDAALLDSRSGHRIANLRGHSDFSFATAWHPDGNVVVTGNQDCTLRVWDVRKLGQSLQVLRGNVGAIRSIRFSGDGSSMVFAEPVDFVHVVDTKLYKEKQEIDFFGEVAGIATSPDEECDTLFVSVSENIYGSLLEFKKSQDGAASKLPDYFP